MKLKKAMKKYDIKVTNLQNPHYRIGERVIFRSSSSGNLWWGDSADIHQFSESEAVNWLIAGATPLSPMERAMRKWPIEKKDDGYFPTYKLGDRHVFHSSVDDYWMECDTSNGMECDTSNGMTKYTESEAVAYLLEGYKPELKPIEFEIFGGTVMLGSENAQKVLDTIWRAGYRPTKEVK